MRNDSDGPARMVTARLAPGSNGLKLGPVLLGPAGTPPDPKTGETDGVGMWMAYPPTSQPDWSKNGYDWNWLKPLEQSQIPAHTEMSLVYELTLPPGVTLGDSKGMAITYQVGHHRFTVTTPGEIQIPDYPAKCKQPGASSPPPS